MRLLVPARAPCNLIQEFRPFCPISAFVKAGYELGIKFNIVLQTKLHIRTDLICRQIALVFQKIPVPRSETR